MKHFKPEQDEAEVMGIIDKALALYYSTMKEKKEKDIVNEESECDEMEI